MQLRMALSISWILLSFNPLDVVAQEDVLLLDGTYLLDRFNSYSQPQSLQKLEREFQDKATNKTVRPLKYWFNRLSSNDPKVRKDAVGELSGHPDLQRDRVDVLSAQSARESERVRDELKSILPELNKLLTETDDEIRRWAIQGLTLIGPDAAAARPLLLQIVQQESKSNSIWFDAFTAIFYVTPKNTPVGRQLWCQLSRNHSQDFPTPQVGPEEQAKNDATGAAFGAVVITLMLVETGRTTIEIPTMAQIANNPLVPRAIRLLILESLSLLGTDAHAAVPVLCQLLQDPDLLIQLYAFGALLPHLSNRAGADRILSSIKVGEEIRTRWKNVVNEEFDRRSRVRDSVLKLSEDQWLFEILLYQAGREVYPFYQRQALRELGRYGSQAKSAVPVIVMALHSGEPETREAAFNALLRIDPSTVPSVFMPEYARTTGAAPITLRWGTTRANLKTRKHWKSHRSERKLKRR